jgi:hypothetical protein
MLGFKRLIVSPGALISVGDTEADYQPPATAVAYTRLNVQHTKTDPFTGGEERGGRWGHSGR